MSEQDAGAAAQAGMRASEERLAHYAGNVAGQGAGAGDPAPAPSQEQPETGAQVAVT